MFKILLLTLLVLSLCIFAEMLPENCAEAVNKCNRSGIYQIQPRPQGKVIFSPFLVYCQLDLKGGDAWTVIQRRQNGYIDFYRGWKDYKTGFGSLTNEFWLGLENIHALTYDSRQELWVQLTHPNGTTAYALYTAFAVGNEDQDYPLIILGNYSGNAGSALRHHEGMKFSTRDRKNNPGHWDCARLYLGAWWYNKCHQSNLNGNYSDVQYGKGVIWGDFTGYNISLKYSHMAIRRKHHRC